MKFFIFVGTLAAVTKAFSPAPGLSYHYSAKTTSGKENGHQYASHAPSSFVKGGGSVMIPPPRNNSLLDMSSSDSDEEATHANNEAEDGDGDNDGEKMAKKVVGRKKRVVVGYTLASILYLLTTVRAILPQVNQLSVGMIAYASCGSVLASGLAFIQKGAAENDRLRSDTYKRLNIFMAWHGFLMSIITLKAFGPDPFALMTNVIAMVNSIKGYGYGARGWTLREGVPFVEDLTQGVKNTVQGMIGSFPQNMKAAGYFLGTATAGTLKVSKSIEVSKLLLQSGGSISFLVGTSLFRCTKLGMLAVCMYTLKDAADRDRLNGTTFIQLNFLCSLVWASMAYYIYEKYPLALFGTKATLRPSITAALAGFLALFTASNGILSIAEKKNA